MPRKGDYPLASMVRPMACKLHLQRMSRRHGPDATETFFKREFIMKTFMATLMVAMALATSFVVTGCNTVAGVGKDIERGGEKLQGEAREHQR